MSDQFTEKETERIKEAAKDLAEEIGINQLATALSMRPVQIVSIIRGGRPISKEFAEGIARAAGVTLEDLRALATEPQGKKERTVARSVPAGGATTPTIGREPVARIEAPSPQTIAEPPSIAAPPTIAEPPKIAPIDPSPPPAPVVAAAPMHDLLPTALEPTKRQDDSRPPTLALLEWADVSMGLEVLPDRRDVVFRKYGLLTQSAQDAESAAWDRYFEENPRDRRDFEAMRERMRRSWTEFDRKPAGPAPTSIPSTLAVTASNNVPPAPPTVASPLRFDASPIEPPASIHSTLSTGAPLPPPMPIDRRSEGNETDVYDGISVFDEPPAPTPPIVVAPQTTPATTPALPLTTYAMLCVEVQNAKSPAHAEAIFTRYGLADSRQRTAVDAAWRERLSSNPSEYAEFERMCRECRAIMSPPTTTATAHSSTAATLPSPSMSLAEYASMCIELEMKPLDHEAIYARHGLVHPTKRRAVHDAWNARFAAMPQERAEYDALMKRFRDEWIDL